ncbi:MAG: DUF4244 domain-containing protein, partial [Canibacter sp.]
LARYDALSQVCSKSIHSAAVAFAGLLVVIMRSSEVRGLLTQLVEDALSSAG